MNTASTPSCDPDFEALLTSHLGAVHAFARKLTGHEQDAEDLAHDALMRAYRFHHRFQRGTNLKAWLFRILRNTFVNRWRESTRRPVLQTASIDFEALAEQRGADLDEAGQTPFVDPQTACGSSELGDAIGAAMARLSRSHREVVQLCLVEGLSQREAAEALGVPPGTVMSRLHRARKQLQEQLAFLAMERSDLVAAA